MRSRLHMVLAGALLLIQPCTGLAADGRTAVAETQSGDTDQDLLGVEAVRLAVMLDQMARLLHRPVAAAAHDTPKNRPEILGSLGETVSRFNGLLPLACARYRSQIADCSAYRPTWLDRADADLPSALDETYARITPAWSAVCTTRKNRCPIE